MATVKEIMSTDLVTVAPEAPVNSFKDIFKRRGIHHVLVEENDKLLGIISTVDVERVKPLMLEGDLVHADHIMTVHPVVVTPEMPVTEVAAIFMENRFHAIPVLESKRLVGIVCVHDVLEEFIRLQKA